MAMMNSSLAPDCDVTHIWWISAFGCGRLVFAGYGRLRHSTVYARAADRRRYCTVNYQLREVIIPPIAEKCGQHDDEGAAGNTRNADRWLW